MKTLNPFQLALIYLALFNMDESGNYEEAEYDYLNTLLKENGEPNSNQYIPDDDGGPINASAEVYAAFNNLILDNIRDNDLEPTQWAWVSWVMDEKPNTEELRTYLKTNHEIAKTL